PVEANLWTDLKFPTVVSGQHVFTPSVQFNSFGGFAAIAYTTTYGYDPVNDPHGPYARNEYGALLDPFFLPDHQAPQLLDSRTVTLPARSFLITPNLSGPTPEGIRVFVTQANADGSGPDVINRIKITQAADGTLATTNLAQVGSQATTGSTIFSLNES